MNMHNLLSKSGLKLSRFLRIIIIIGLVVFVDASIATGLDKEKELCDRYLMILEQGVDFFETIYSEGTPNNCADTGFYDLRRYGNWTHPRNEPYHTLCMIPGNGQVVLTYAVLLKYTQKNSFGISGTKRKTLFEHARKTIRWTCKTSAYIEESCPFLPEIRQDLANGQQWKRRWGLRQDLLGYLSVGVAVLWDDLDEDTKALFRKVAAGAALRGRVVRTMDRYGNGNHDQVKQDLSSTVGAAYLFSRHPEHDKFMEAVFGAGLDMVSTPKDKLSNKIVLGDIPLSELSKSANLNSDYSSFHHNHPSLWYGIDLIFEGRSYVEILSGLTHQTVPASYTYQGNGFDGVYQYACTLATNDGVLMHLRNPEYDCCYGGGLLAFCYGGAIQKDPKGAYLEMRAAQVIQEHTRAVKQYDYHRGSWAKAAMAFLIHQLNPGGPYSIANEESLKSLVGVHSFESLRATVHRTVDKWASFVWGSDGQAGAGGPGAYVASADPGGPFLYNTLDSLSGSFLEHRPWWMYGVLIAFVVLGITFYMIIDHYLKKPLLADVCLFIAAASFTSGVLIFWIDFQFTSVMRLPEAAAPRTSLLANNFAAAIIILSCTAFSSNKKNWTGIVLTAMLAVPLVLLSMTRTPWLEIIHSTNVFAAEWLNIFMLIGIAAFFYLFPKYATTKIAGLAIGILLALYSIIGLLTVYGSNNVEPFYLRLVSIRNIPRIKILIVIGLALFLLSLAAKLMKMTRSQKYFLILGVLFIFSSLPIAFLSMGRFKQLPNVRSVSSDISDYGFSTTGEAVTPAVLKRQAFFSFNEGVCITMVSAKSRRACRLSYSGLPVAFYQRDGFVAPRTVCYNNDSSEISRLGTVESSWWCVDGKIGMIISGDDTRLRGKRRLGANWARTESYLDRMDILFSSPLDYCSLKKNQKIINMVAGVYPSLSVDDIKMKTKTWKHLDQLLLPPGWFGVIAQGKNDGFILAVANLSDNESTEKIKVKWDHWVPILTNTTIISQGYSELTFTLKPFETYAEEGVLLIRSEVDEPIVAKRLGPSSYELVSSDIKPSTVRLKWAGLEGKQLIYKNEKTGEIEKIDTDSLNLAKDFILKFSNNALIFYNK